MVESGPKFLSISMIKPVLGGDSILFSKIIGLLMFVDAIFLKSELEGTVLMSRSG